MGPLNDFEKHIYGYSMPQGRKHEHFDFYTNHNQEVEAYFAGRPDKLLKVCWDEGENIRTACRVSQSRTLCGTTTATQRQPASLLGRQFVASSD